MNTEDRLDALFQKPDRVLENEKKKKMMKPPQFTQILSNLKKVGEMLMNGYVTEHVISQVDSVWYETTSNCNNI